MRLSHVDARVWNPPPYGDGQQRITSSGQSNASARFAQQRSAGLDATYRSLLARAVLEAPRIGQAQLNALHDYERTRDRLSKPLFDVTEGIASYNWDLEELRGRLGELSQAMRPEVDALLVLDQMSAA
jgi:hypothetical protein